MSYWELETEEWEAEDNYDGAHWMTMRGRIELLENSYLLNNTEESN